MGDPRPTLSISRAYEMAIASWRAHGRLLGAIALAFFALPGTLVGLVAPPTDLERAPEPSSGLLLLMLLYLLSSFVGQLAIARLLLAPASSVRDAIGFGARRLPAALGATALAMMPLFIALLVVAGRIQDQAARPSGILVLVFLLLTAAIFLVSVRMMLVVPVAAAEEGGAPGLIRRCFTLARGQFLRLAAVLSLFVFVAFVVLLAVQLVTGSVVIVLLGQPEPLTVAALVTALLTQVPQAFIAAGLMVLLAQVYRQLSGRA